MLMVKKVFKFKISSKQRDHDGRIANIEVTLNEAVDDKFSARACNKLMFAISPVTEYKVSGVKSEIDWKNYFRVEKNQYSEDELIVYIYDESDVLYMEIPV